MRRTELRFVESDASLKIEFGGIILHFCVTYLQITEITLNYLVACFGIARPELELHQKIIIVLHFCDANYPKFSEKKIVSAAEDLLLKALSYWGQYFIWN